MLNKKSYTNAGLHFLGSVLAICLIAVPTFLMWYPSPINIMTGGGNIFLLLIAVNILCGPLLTLFVSGRKKTKNEALFDFGVIVVLQGLALIYGIWSIQTTRPIYLVHELDRFKLISSADVDPKELDTVSKSLTVGLFEPLKPVSLRAPNPSERKEVLFESVQGGRDYGERPIFYIEYSGASVYATGKEVESFIKTYGTPENYRRLEKILNQHKISLRDIRYVPIIAKEDWVAVLKADGEVTGYLKGDGFAMQ